MLCLILHCIYLVFLMKMLLLLQFSAPLPHPRISSKVIDFTGERILALAFIIMQYAFPLEGCGQKSNTHANDSSTSRALTLFLSVMFLSYVN